MRPLPPTERISVDPYSLRPWMMGDVPVVHLFMEPWNGASVATAERCGFVREGLLRSRQEIAGTRRDMYVYARVW